MVGELGAQLQTTLVYSPLTEIKVLSLQAKDQLKWKKVPFTQQSMLTLLTKGLIPSMAGGALLIRQ
ncbi:uncharacterized protein LOC117173217 isoform X2 [Belonocnema kinseyi]|uniref:uncharacterized protein LOC117173217 isoform X2 n=1 Tax=Belonocnema kinseyi TaxID=2817044 RepID=UPI00143DA84F|nr:uncharacterized protein LOC117173217 isoform X2 [Belonocnema kinseyi]